MGHVDFIIDGTAVFSDSLPPYSYTWNTLGEAEDSDHVININLSDSAGNTTSLFPVTVFVNNIVDTDVTPPNIVIYDPAANQTVSGTVTFLTIATDDIAVDRVEFYHNYELDLPLHPTHLVMIGTQHLRMKTQNTYGMQRHLIRVAMKHKLNRWCLLLITWIIFLQLALFFTPMPGR